MYVWMEKYICKWRRGMSNKNFKLCCCYQCDLLVNGDKPECKCLFIPILSDACTTCPKKDFCFVLRNIAKYE